MMKNMVMLSTGVLLSLYCSIISADVLHLKNGETLRGLVEEAGDSYTITLAFGKAVFARAEVERVEKEPVPDFYRGNAEELLAQKQFARANREFEKWAASGGEEAELRLFKGRLLLAVGEQHLRCGEIKQAAAVLTSMPEGASRTTLQTALQEFEKHTADLLQAGKAWYAAGEFEKAFVALRELYIINPEKQPEFKEAFVETHIKLGLGSYAQNDYARTIRFLDSALALDGTCLDRIKDEWVTAKMKLIKANYQQRQWKNCDEIIRSLVDVTPENAEVLYTAGEVSLRLEKHRDAYNYFAEILDEEVKGTAAAPDAGEVAAIQKRARALIDTGVKPPSDRAIADEESGYYTVATDNFRVYAATAAVAERGSATLEHYYYRIRSRFQTAGGPVKLWKGICTVFIFPDRATFMKYTDGCLEAGTTQLVVTEGKLEDIIIYAHEDSPGLFLNILGHELGHAVLSFLARDNGSLPLCLQEGFAVSVEPLFRRRYYTDLFQEAVLKRRYVGLRELLVLEAYPAWKTSFYAQSYTLADFLIREMGMDRFLAFTRAIPDLGAEKALLKYTKARNLRALQKEWITAVRAGRAGTR